MPKAAELAAWRQQAALATAQGSKSFYFASRFFPKPLAEQAWAVYWFCRTSDDIVDENPDVESAGRQLAEWREALVAAMDGRPVQSPVLQLFAYTQQEVGFSREYPLELLEGMRMDLEKVRYQNFPELRLFCYRVASVVGLMMSHCIGFQGDALVRAEELGIAMQLTNILRDIAEDWQRGRVYLPAEEMAQFGYTLEDLAAQRRNENFRQLMVFQASRARQFYASSLPGIALLRPEGRFAVEIAAKVYRGILDRIEEMDYDVFRERAVVPSWQKYSITARALALPMARRAAGKLGMGSMAVGRGRTW